MGEDRSKYKCAQNSRCKWCYSRFENTAHVYRVSTGTHALLKKWRAQSFQQVIGTFKIECRTCLIQHLSNQAAALAQVETSLSTFLLRSTHKHHHKHFPSLCHNIHRELHTLWDLIMNKGKCRRKFFHPHPHTRTGHTYGRATLQPNKARYRDSSPTYRHCECTMTIIHY